MQSWPRPGTVSGRPGRPWRPRSREERLPRQETTYEKLILRVDPRGGDLRETTVVDLLGNATTVAFRDVETNRDPASDLFRFEPPPGVRVVDLEAGSP